MNHASFMPIPIEPGPIHCCHSTVVFALGTLHVTRSAIAVWLAAPMLIALSAIALGPTTAHAQGWLHRLTRAGGSAANGVSASTSTAEPDCRSERPRRKQAATAENGGTRVGPGVHGFVVLVSENDLRETVSVGRNRAFADKEPAAKKWFGPFSSAATTVEWRSRRSSSRPYAIIQRWSLADNNDPDKDGRPRDKQMLVVTRLPPGGVCHIAYVDVAANTNANELARKAADETARNFDCAKDKVRILGTPGRATELAQ